MPQAFALGKQLILRESLPDMKISYDPGIRLTNQYVRNTEENLKESSKGISGYYDYDRCNSSIDEAFSVSIGPENIQRALIILQTLCNALTKRGSSIQTKPKEPKDNHQSQYGYTQREVHPIYAFVLDTYISFRITETSTKLQIPEKGRKHSYQEFMYKPSGKLCFEITNSPYGNYSRSRGQDGKVLKVENQLNDIIINIIKFATMQKELEALAEVRRKQYKIEEEKRREQEKLARINKSRIQKLVEETDQMVKLNQIKLI